MAQIVMLKNPKTGIVKKGFYGFSWTVLFFGGFPPLFRGDIVTAILAFVLYWLTAGIGTLIWAFFYNKQFTTKLIEQGYELADTEARNAMARSKLGIVQIAAPVASSA